MELRAYLTEKRRILDKALEGFLPEPEGPAADIVRAMKYSLFAGGKRLRPILCIAGAESVGGKEQDVLPVACAIELIHTYSLIHDDLPAMDNDDMRRGKPTSHKIFGEAVALLAGDALLTEAFHLMTCTDYENTVKPGILLNVIGILSEASGYEGMVGGQVVDIQSEGKIVDPSILEFIHTHKTGALIAASVTSGAMLGGGVANHINALSSYGQKIGLAFQVSADIHDIEGDARELGKNVGSAASQEKVTYPGLLGFRRAKEIKREMVELVRQALNLFNHRADPLRQIARYVIERKG